MDKIKTLKEMIDKSSNIVVFSGAGMSVASGIPDFRSANGIYSQKCGYSVSPEEIVSHSFFMANPEEFYDFYFKKMVYLDAKPNKAHLYFANLGKKKLVKIVTQNIDSLDKAAGSKIVYEIHGTIRDNYCMKCHKFYKIEDIVNMAVPRCSCGGLIKPDVVLYEEGLDETLITQSIRAIESADMVIVIGTSLSVYPAASFIRYYPGHRLVLINKTKTNYDSYANLVINDDIIHVVEELERLDGEN